MICREEGENWPDSAAIGSVVLGVTTEMMGELDYMRCEDLRLSGTAAGFGFSTITRSKRFAAAAPGILLITISVVARDLSHHNTT